MNISDCGSSGDGRFGGCSVGWVNPIRNTASLIEPSFETRSRYMLGGRDFA